MSLANRQHRATVVLACLAALAVPAVLLQPSAAASSPASGSPVSAAGVGPDLERGAADHGPWGSPLPPAGERPHVVHEFDPPEQDWGSGHRGVDLHSDSGGAVLAAGAGEVTFAGNVADKPVVTVTHGSLRTTYEPVLPVVRRGQQVQVGDRIGLLADRAGHCEPRSCLHWGLRQGDEYLDPLTLLGSPDAGQGPVRLLPLGDRTLTEEPPPAPSTPPPGDDSGDGDGSLSFPISPATVTSPFGTRVHPVTGVRKLHDGTDFGAGCGTPVTASAAGTVTGTGPRGAYGLQVAVAHPDIGAGLSTSYSHLSAIDVAPGAHVQRGQQVGRVGTTGMSTGCHLHFMVTVGGAAQDPMTWLG